MTEMVESDFQLYFNHDILEISPGADVKQLEEADSTDRKSTRLNSSHKDTSRMPSSA